MSAPVVEVALQAPLTDEEIVDLMKLCACNCGAPRCNAVLMQLALQELKLRRAISGSGS